MSNKHQYQEMPRVELSVLQVLRDPKNSRNGYKEKPSSRDGSWLVKPSKRESKKAVSPEQLGQYRELFRTFDKDGSGSIDIEELNDMLKTCGMQMDPADLGEIIEEYDEDNNGTIDFEEFVQIFVHLVPASNVDQEQLSSSSSEPQIVNSSRELSKSVEQELTERQHQNLDGNDDSAPIQLAEDQLQVKDVKVKKAKPPPPKPKLLYIPGRAYMFDQGFSQENLKDHVESVHHLKTEIQEVEVDEEIVEANPEPMDAPAPEVEEEAPEPPKKKVKMKVKRKYNCCKTSLG